jgi:hypothetical protein
MEMEEEGAYVAISAKQVEMQWLRGGVKDTAWRRRHARQPLLGVRVQRCQHRGAVVLVLVPARAALVVAACCAPFAWRVCSAAAGATVARPAAVFDRLQRPRIRLVACAAASVAILALLQRACHRLVVCLLGRPCGCATVVQRRDRASHVASGSCERTLRHAGIYAHSGELVQTC